MGKPQTTSMIIDKIQSRVLIMITGNFDMGSQVSFLGRKRTDEGIFFKSPDGYAEQILETLGLSHARGAKTTGSSYSNNHSDRVSYVDQKDNKLYRGVVGKLLWLCPIRPDLTYATKELSRSLQAPTYDDMDKLKHLCRYLLGTK